MTAKAPRPEHVDMPDVPDFSDIGRPIDTDWRNEFIYTFHEITQDLGIDLEPQVEPGIFYLSGADIKRRFREGDPSVKNCESSEDVVAKLLHYQVVDNKYALSALTLTVYHLGFYKKKSRIDVRAVLSDTDPEQYGGYVSENEKRSIQHVFHIPFGFATNNNPPIHGVSLGSIPKNLPRNYYDRVQTQLLNYVEVGPIAAIKRPT